MNKFKEGDTNGDGVCDRDEVKAVLNEVGIKFTEKEFNNFYDSIDENGDGVLSFEEIDNKLVEFKK